MKQRAPTPQAPKPKSKLFLPIISIIPLLPSNKIKTQQKFPENFFWRRDSTLCAIDAWMV
jgi:hypothetical protein